MKRILFYNQFCLWLLVGSLISSCNNNKESQGKSGERTIGESLPDASDSRNAVAKKKIPKLTREKMSIALKDYLLPSPGLVFNALNQWDKNVWSKHTNFTVNSDYNNDLSRSFGLGRAVADAFISIKAGNEEKLRDINTVIFSLAKEIGIEKTLNEHKAKLSAALNNKNSDSLNRSFEAVNQEITNAFKTNIVNGDDYLTLASIGGWIEGTFVITNILSTSNYSEEAATNIKQPDLLKFLINSVNNSTAQFPQKKALQENLSKILVFFSVEGDLTKDELTQINSIAKTIINQFQS